MLPYRITGSVRQLSRVSAVLCKDCDHVSNDQTGTGFKHSAVARRKWFLAVYMYLRVAEKTFGTDDDYTFLAVYTYLRVNTSFGQLDVEINVSYKTIYRRVQRFLRVLDAPRPQIEDSIEIGEFSERFSSVM